MQEIPEILDKLKQKLANGVSLAVEFADGAGSAEFFGSGIKPLLNAVLSAAPLLYGAVCADKIVGKAAALLFVYAKARFVYAELISDLALKVLRFYGVSCAFAKLVPYIQNRLQTGQCPTELLCSDTANPDEALRRLCEFMNNGS